MEYILRYLFDFALFLYFASTGFYPRKNYVLSTVLSLAGYGILFRAGLTVNAPLMIMLFFATNTALLISGYRVNPRNAVFYSLILTTLSCIGEYMFLCFPDAQPLNNMNVFSSKTLFWFFIAGKLAYMSGVLFLSRFTVKRTNIYDSAVSAILSVIPLLSTISLSVILSVNMGAIMFLVLCAVFFLINFITFYINAELINRNIELKSLQAEYKKNKAKLSEYQMLSDSSETSKIMRRDLDRQLDVLRELIGSDNQNAKEYIRQMKIPAEEINYTKYTDNAILNILLTQKANECRSKDIVCRIHSKFPSLAFISDIDTVAIFSNMIDNAIEATEQSEKKEIYIDLYTVNNSYSVVKIENYADNEPVIRRGMLRTQKKEGDIHGFGVKSINNALQKYGSEFVWSYDADRKFFKSSAMIHVPKQN